MHMVNSDKFSFGEFTYKYYRWLLLCAKKRYEFKRFDNFSLDDRDIIFWRHDVDFSPEGAVRFAKIEAELGVQGVYFFLLG